MSPLYFDRGSFDVLILLVLIEKTNHLYCKLSQNTVHKEFFNELFTQRTKLFIIIECSIVALLFAKI